MFNIAVVEDENTAADHLSVCIEKYGQNTGEKFNIIRFYDAEEFVNGYKPIYDIVFMDIILPKKNGLDGSKKLRILDKDVVLIFVTNMANYAVKGYEVDALDFIIKPVVYESFAMKMDKAVSVATRRKSFDISIPLEGAIKVISAAKVYFIEVSGHYLIYHTEEGEFKARGTLSGIKTQLEKENFSQCNVCYLVNLKFVTEIKADTVTVGKKLLKISRARKKDFINMLTNYLGRSV